MISQVFNFTFSKLTVALYFMCVTVIGTLDLQKKIPATDEMYSIG